MKYLCNLLICLFATIFYSIDCYAQSKRDITTKDFRDPALGTTVTTKLKGGADEKIYITIYYRWDKENLDSTYLTNSATLHQIDSLLHLKSAKYIDSLRIVAFASPEGPPDYNKRLSQRRANTLKNYLLTTYPKFKDEQIITLARGENWDGFRRMAEADSNLPMKEQVLSIINDKTISDLQRQAEIARLDGGRLYKNYILPNYYRYLRNGASLFVIYNSAMPADIDFKPAPLTITEPVLVDFIQPKPGPVYDTILRSLLAIRTNLLYDAVGALNIGIEVPFGQYKNWSMIADFAYAYWRSAKNLYALQTLEYGTELRYWFPVSAARKERNPHWTQPLKGFYIGMYGRYWHRYDVQFVDGYQGDGSWSAGLTIGYTVPLDRSLSIDLGIGAGWFSTSQYRHYHQPEYDEKGNYHLMWQETGSWGGLALTKVRVALVWLIQTKRITKGGVKK